MRGTYTAAAFAFAAFAVWGSLFPFELQRVSWPEILASFFAAWQTGPASWSRSDFVSNVLLFVPIGLFGAAALDATWTRAPALNAVAVIAAAFVLSLGLELAQACIVWRTSSVVDVLAETCGAALGCLWWRASSVHIDDAAAAAHALVARAAALERALLGYAVLFAIGWLLPFDFTLRPNEIADKFAHGRLLLPFMPSPDGFPPSTLLAIAAAAMPLGIVVVRLRARARRPIAHAMLILVPGLLALEIGQALVFSRTTDTRGMLAALIGALAGAAAARRARTAVLGF